jgi:hypothetical protein
MSLWTLSTLTTDRRRDQLDLAAFFLGQPFTKAGVPGGIVHRAQ